MTFAIQNQNNDFEENYLPFPAIAGFNTHPFHKTRTQANWRNKNLR